MSRAERAALLELDGSTIPLSVQAKLLGVSRSSLYYTPRPPSPEEAAIRRQIDEIFTAHPSFGSRRITEALRRQGWHVNRKRIQRCMRDMQIAGICPGPNLSRRDLQSRLFAYLLRGLGHRHHVHTAPGKLDVSRGRHRLVLSLHCRMGGG